MKRIIYGTLWFLVILSALVIGNQYIVDIFFSAIAIIAVNEFFNVFKNKANPVKWIGYLFAGAISFIHILPETYVNNVVSIIIPIIIAILFLQIIITGMKINFDDIAVTFLGICYVVIFISFIPRIRALENGYILIWLLFLTSWGTDIFAYYIGKNIGKHKFTKISPNKTIEGCARRSIWSYTF